jgi:hypothetical protein
MLFCTGHASATAIEGKHTRKNKVENAGISEHLRFMTTDINPNRMLRLPSLARLCKRRWQLALSQ